MVLGDGALRPNTAGARPVLQQLRGELAFAGLRMDQGVPLSPVHRTVSSRTIDLSVLPQIWAKM